MLKAIADADIVDKIILVFTFALSVGNAVALNKIIRHFGINP